MRALHQLIHALAKEEKRLYKLHGREARFTHIYEGYLQSAEFSKELDREIFANHFSKFSKSFYSMQKQALLEDLLAVLLEYSNSSREEFVLTKYRAKYEVLLYKGFPELALQFLRSALDSAEKAGNHKQILRVLEDFRDVLARCESVSWEEYNMALVRLEQAKEESEGLAFVEAERQKLQVLTSSARNNPDDTELYHKLSREIMDRLREIGEKETSPAVERELIECEVEYCRAFEDRIALHKRLVTLERELSAGEADVNLRLRVTNLLIESALDCGDFLLINGIIYKTKRLDMTDEQKAGFMPRFLELCGVYHFYENDLPLSQRELQEILDMEDIEAERLMRNYYHKISVLIAANLPKAASEALAEFVKRFPDQKHEVQVKIMELVIAIEQNDRETALDKLQRLQTFIRKSPESRSFGHVKAFLQMVQKFLNKKPVTWEEIPGLRTNWDELLKLNQWLKAKIDNAFYYNYILDYWQAQKQILNV